MKKNAIFTLLVCVAVLAGCAAPQPKSDEESANQRRAEEQRRVQAIMSGH
jgi:outer membrane biogenesis lipoprotein LolB